MSLPIKAFPKLREHLGKKVVPIQPFLVVKAHQNKDEALNRSLNQMGADGHAGVPNTIAWNEAMGTQPAGMVDKPINGRRIISDDEDTPPHAPQAA
jgi:hypothetical protein